VGSPPPRPSPGLPSKSLSSIATITICSNRCFIKLPPPAFLLRTLRRRSAAFFAGKGTRPWFSPRSRAWTSTGAKSSLKVGGIHFDHLIISTGAQHAYFGNGDWAFSAPGLKTIDDATYLRRRILLAFERAKTELDPAEQRRLLNFVVVGDGPTGVEMAGAIAELARRALASDFRTIDPRLARIILVQAGPRLLPALDPSLSNAALRSLGELGVERIRTTMWAAGVMASPAGDWLGADMDRAGRVKVAADLSVPGHPHIFVIGDTAHAPGRDGQPLPGVAPVAKQQGQYVANLLAARAKGRTASPSFFEISARWRQSAANAPWRNSAG
jgi:NADH dehydrogenase FAD-containing subunit